MLKKGLSWKIGAEEKGKVVGGGEEEEQDMESASISYRLDRQIVIQKVSIKKIKGTDRR